MTASTRYIHFKGKTEAVVKGIDGLWRTLDGTIIAFAEEADSADKEVRPGVGFFSWRSWWIFSDELTDAARPHDYMYSSPAYQMFHTRAEADNALEETIREISKEKDEPALAYFALPFRKLANWLGSGFWENPNTR